MISDYYDKTAEVGRLATVSGYKKAYAAHIASQPCHLQPIQDALSQDIAGGFGKDFTMFTDVVDIAEGDRVVIEGLEYRVMGLSKHDFLGHQHMETRLRTFDTLDQGGGGGPSP